MIGKVPVNLNYTLSSEVMAKSLAKAEIVTVITAEKFLHKLAEKGFRPEIAGMCSDTEICTVDEFILKIKAGTMEMFLMNETGAVRIIKSVEAIL